MLTCVFFSWCWVEFVNATMSNVTSTLTSQTGYDLGYILTICVHDPNGTMNEILTNAVPAQCDLDIHLVCDVDGWTGGVTYGSKLCTSHSIIVVTRSSDKMIRKIGLSHNKNLLHEIGHLLGAPHSEPVSDCSYPLMSYCGLHEIPGWYFHENSIRAMQPPMC